MSSDETKNEPSENLSGKDAEPKIRKSVEVPEEELAALKQEAQEFKDKYLRTLAEMENARKRLQRERQEITQLSIERVIIDFLHPLDNLENALKFAGQQSPEVKNWAMGFQMILDQFKEVLSQHGVKLIPVEGVEFDPHQHEAIELIETSDSPPGTILEECARGYKMGNRTIRPSRVKVACASASQENQTEQTENN